jgi:hypothetical protein
MIGWRPYLVSLLALLLVAVVVLNVDDAGRKPDPCKAAYKLYGAKNDLLLAQARVAYLAVLTKNPDSSCAKDGLVLVSDAQCQRARLIAPAAPHTAHKLLVAIASADPPTPVGSCVWRALGSLPGEK